MSSLAQPTRLKKRPLSMFKTRSATRFYKLSPSAARNGPLAQLISLDISMYKSHPRVAFFYDMLGTINLLSIAMISD